ncbi:DNA-binding protein [Pseudomonas auratipiscis]|uniref:DNA-binding protein n=1 Tax=Pseudomonas auratipiscis TaxID=3115853 RepID=A0AB35WNM7_9PSED|nr:MULTISPECIES: DNA-binding protein [unclassified Pseudomonas]MEE1864804.1 DNA-binding protein [Pseudomonas sp. 120P]MEE1956255.1 DNA-binding protein [Pseudomonas sp. 119P]
MARGGINKAVVQKARQALLTRGVHPSIDAVRIELGNTGSKTTIHRYLKELDTQYPASPASTPNLSDALANLVEQLAEQLREEGEARIALAQAAFERERQTLLAQVQISQQALAALQQQHEIQAAALAGASAELATARSTLQTEQTRNATLNQSVGELQLRLADKDEQIVSLEDKHQHARDALEHYRTASREQREQEQRRHEGQVQQLQVELRQLQQTLIVKQDELTRLNRDNEGLLVQIRTLKEGQRTLKTQADRRQAQIQGLEINLAQLNGSRDELEKQNQNLALSLAERVTELRQQLQLIGKLEAQLRQAEKLAHPVSAEDSSA